MFICMEHVFISLLQPRPCALDILGVPGYTRFLINLVRFENPTDLKATGVRCDFGPTDLCDIYVEICVSSIGQE